MFMFYSIPGLKVLTTQQTFSNLFKFSNRNTRKVCEICSKLTIEMPEQEKCSCSCFFIVNYEDIYRHFL